MSKKSEAIKLRLGGKSYGEIQKLLNISSKGTLSYWFRNLNLPIKAKKILAKKVFNIQKRGLLEFNKRRTALIKEENQRILIQAQKEIPRLSRKDLLILGTALYWGEGTTREKQRGYQRIAFSNSDPEMVKVFMAYLRKVLEVKEDKIKAEIHTYPNLSKERATRFWSINTGLPTKRFYIYQRISGASRLVRPTNFLPYGTLNIRVNDRKLFSRIKGYIAGITAQSLLW